ncbi:MAG: alpha/beta hydrolase [Shinella sp.]|nr:alpha/beta hydrolase [Shinella sp.]
MKNAVSLCLCAFLFGGTAMAEEPSYGARLEGFDYPFTTEIFNTISQNQPVEMAFMDIAAAQPNGRTVVLLHGKNFCAATWEGTIAALSDAGYRVIAPDQVGFCKSSKPENYQYSFHALAHNTRALLDQRGIDRAIIVGHLMGGMLAARYTLMYPQDVETLVMVNPIGLEDWKAKGVPYTPVGQGIENELKTTAESIRAYQEKFYYNGQWRPEYDRWVSMQAGIYRGEGREIVARAQALTSDMVYTQPVVHEFGNIAVRTVLMIGQTDRTAPGAAAAPADVAGTLGNYPALGKEAAERIPQAELVEFAELGHSPQIQDPERFHAALLKALAEQK